MEGDRSAGPSRAAFACVPLLALLCALWTAPPARAADAAVVSTLEGVQPPASGLELEVVGGDRFLVLTNGTGKQVVVKGYDDEPYLRFLPNRVVEVNSRSPSKYANEDRYALRPVPPQANSDATPRWQTVSRDGSYRWFDHRIHLMEKGTPPQVTDEGKRTRIFNWDVPMTVGGQDVKAVGTLDWVPASSSGTSPVVFIGIAAAALAIGAGVFLLMRRRRGGAPAGGRGEPAEEAW